jgi:hypothetical protein
MACRYAPCLCDSSAIQRCAMERGMLKLGWMLFEMHRALHVSASWTCGCKAGLHRSGWPAPHVSLMIQ